MAGCVSPWRLTVRVMTSSEGLKLQLGCAVKEDVVYFFLCCCVVCFFPGKFAWKNIFIGFLP